MDTSLTQDEMKKILARRARNVEKFLAHRVQDSVPGRLKDAMNYSLDAGGKRLRPVLCLACASLCGLEEDKAMPFAAAIEMIHTYSLIHDDLPAMDDDDLRRGKPSNHKAFDEATAILAGDGLLTDAFYVASTCDLPAAGVLAAMARLAWAAGSAGMVGGQMLDMVYTGKKTVTLEDVARMQKLKTGAMLQASCVCGAILAGVNENVINLISAYGQALGRAFQIVDDILDVTGDTATLGKPAGSDSEKGKNTYPSLAGLDLSRELAVKDAEIAKNAIAAFTGPEAAFLRSLADYTVQRVK